MTLLSFHNKKSIKIKYVNRLQKHYDQDEIIHGKYWEDGKGCAVGCTVHSDSHSCYEKELGIPIWLALLEDTLFEGMTNGFAKEFPLQFLKAIPIGKDLTIVRHQFAKYCLDKICKNTDYETVREAIRVVNSLHQRCIDEGFMSVTDGEWSAARSAAESAARSAAESAARSAESARSARSATWSARSAAESTWSARSAAESARSARSATWSARSATWSARSAAESARSAAESAAYEKMAKKLVQLLKEVK